MAGAVSLDEPQVLAHAKRRLFPNPDESDTYVVCDTQFATAEWLSGHPIDPSVRGLLAPFNHVRLGSGYPDLVGVRYFEDDILAVDPAGERPPLVAVEAKGYTVGGGVGTVDVERGILQAYDRLSEANAAFVAAPHEAITTIARTLARELDVGVLGVEADGHVRVLEVPRVVGNHPSGDAAAIRFQATTQGVANRSFGLNHPKNYLAYPLALYHPGETDAVLAERVVGAVESARTGAAFLGLIDERPNRVTLTPLGEEVVRFAIRRYGSVDAALDAFAEWHRSRKRFVDIAPAWGLLARRVVWAYPATRLLIDTLQRLHATGVREPSLVDLVTAFHSERPAFAIELFIRGSDDVRGRVVDGDGVIRPGELTDGDVFHSPTVFQLKAMLYHAGILTHRGSEPNRLDPGADIWALREPLSE